MFPVIFYLDHVPLLSTTFQPPLTYNQAVIYI